MEYSLLFDCLKQASELIRQFIIDSIQSFQQKLKLKYQMGSTCIKIQITTDDLILSQESAQEIHMNIQQSKEQKKTEDLSIFSDDEIQFTSHSFEEIKVDQIQSNNSKIKQIDQSLKIKSILKTSSHSQIVQSPNIRKSVSFCFINPDQYKQMINCKSNISQAQQEFLNTLYASQ
ncbi:unnamed protein product [Paramecium sonneborni]|uniref:Uncharacterized protein n=1 Tax=Paramecium sonneborni TaxID=65129 RepID=A0A8S1RH37_9CILI|nr:unnamed protein product [Paramecium sonneborni]